MSLTVLGSNGGGAGYTMENSVRLRNFATASFSRTPSSAGNRKTWTWSVWVKRGKLDIATPTIFDATGSGNVYHLFRFISDQFTITMDNTYTIHTNAVYRDPSAWYHIVVINDTTQATASNRLKIYVNGVQQSTYFSYGTYPSLNFEGNINGGDQHAFGRYIYGNAQHFDGYVADAYLIDGQALAPTDFGEYDDTTGVWKPKEYTGTYGTNGFYLDMSTSGSTITDQSGNSNNWTATNMNLTTSSDFTYDIMNDVPTLTDEDTGNFATLNVILPNPNSGNMVEANLAWAGASHSGTRGTFGMTSGKWYWEVTNTLGSDNGVGISQDQEALGFLGNAYGWSYYGNGLKYTSGSGTSYGASYTTNDVIGVAFDADAGSLVFYKNGVSQGTAYTGLTSTPYYPAISSYFGSLRVNFGQRPFAYTPPTGYKKLNTYNLPDSTIKDGSQYFDATTYTGNGGTLPVVNSGSFKPSWVWIKSISTAQNNYSIDAVRGVNNILVQNNTLAESYYDATWRGLYGNLTAFNSNGFTVVDGTDPTYDSFNGLDDTYVGWNWRGSDSSPVSNTDGTIESTVSANTTSGFSVVTYTGNGTSGATVGHGLGVAPEVYIIKNRDISSDWFVYTTKIDGSLDWLYLNTTAAKSDSGASAPTSSVFALTSTGGINGSGNDIVSYCFHSVEGFSKFGSYTGNGSTDGPFVYTGFRPKFIMTKRTNTAGFWWEMVDTSRAPVNVANNPLYANVSDAEYTGSTYDKDILSNGFKMRGTNGGSNASGGTYIYMAFAEHPFKNSLAR